MAKTNANQRNRKPKNYKNTKTPQRQRASQSNVYELNRIRQMREKQRRQAQQPVKQVKPARQSQKNVPTKHNAQKAAKRRKIYAGNILPAFVFVVIAIYLAAQIVMMTVRKPEINVETVVYGTIDTPKVQEGLIVRDEYVAKSNRSGMPFYQYSEGEYVSKSAVVCEVKDTASTKVLEEKLQSIDKDIWEMQKDRSDLSTFSEDINRIEKSISATVETFAGRSMKNDTSYLYTMRTQLDNYITQRNEIWLSEDVESLSQLNEKRSAYAKQLSENMSTITAEESGVLAFSYDGLEETLQPEKLEEVQVGDVKSDERLKLLSKRTSVSENDPLFRIVKSNEWHLVSNVSKKDAEGWEVGDALVLHVTGNDKTIPIRAVISALTQQEEQTKVIFSCFSHMGDFIDYRTVAYTVEEKVVKGLKIPNDALVEKSLLKIPLNCLTESNGMEGVLLANGDNAKFMEINAINKDDEYVYLAQNSQGLKMGDVILQGTSENAKQYTIAELKTSVGVYMANSSMAKFVPVVILEQNQEYAVVESVGAYGLQEYDTIVSEAKNITEGQSIY